MCKLKVLPLGLALATLIAFGSFLSTQAIAQESGWISYAAKFTCGNRDNDVFVVNGFYTTVINIHNPHYMPDEGVTFLKKAVRARTQRAGELGKISPKKRELLPPDAALGVDCQDIRNLLGPPESTLPFIEGFLVIEVPPQVSNPQGILVAPPLDVVGVYTVRERSGASTQDGNSIDVEKYEPTHIFGEPFPQ